MSDEEPLYVKDLGKSKRVTVRPFKNLKLVDIREFYEKNGEKLPGRKGISLTKEQFEVLVESLDEIKAALNNETKAKRKKGEDEDEEEDNEGGFEPEVKKAKDE